MSLRIFLRNVLTFFVEGFTRTFPSLYLRTFWPKKSKPVVICVIWVFSCDSSRPRSRIHCSTRGLISFSRSSLELPVIMKSSAYLTRLALAFRLALLAFGYFSRSFASNPSKARLANTGEQIPPCGVPSSVGLRTRFSMKPALSHVALWYIDTPERSWMVSLLLERLYGLCFLLWGFPDFSVYPWCPFALVFSHSFDSKCLAAKRVRQQVLQRLHFAPLALLLSLDDTHLKPPHFLIDRLPVNGVPAHFVVGSCTSSLHVLCHLHCLLSRLLKFSRHERPDGSQPTFVWSLFHLLSIPLQNGARLLHLPLSAALSAFFAVCFPHDGRATDFSRSACIPEDG